MYNRPIHCFPPAPRTLSAVTETGDAQVAPDDAVACAGGCARTPAGGRAAEVTGPVGDGGAGGTRLAAQRYVHARFGDVPVLIAPELAAQIRATHSEQP